MNIYDITWDTRAHVVHSDTGAHVLECSTHTEASKVAAWLSRGEDLYHVEPFADVLVEGPVEHKVVA